MKDRPPSSPIPSLAQLRSWLKQRELSKCFVITGASGRFVDAVRDALDGLHVTHFAEAEVHVPRRVVSKASDALRQAGADVIITLGGGSTTGLGKALRLEHDVAFVAIPTTYSGSEMTRIYGVSEGGEKQTGRDGRVRPDLVVHDVELTLDLPRRLTATSLCNALAHPISALSTGELAGDDRAAALGAIELLARAQRNLADLPHSRDGRRWALLGAAAAASVLDGGELGLHHQIAHRLGGRFGSEHAALHSVLLPHSLRALPAELRREINAAAGVADLTGWLFDLLERTGAVTALAELGIERAALAELFEEHDLPVWVHDAFYGRRPSDGLEPLSLPDVGLRVLHRGAPLARADRVVVALHGRGSSAGAIAEHVRACIGDAPGVAIVAPEGEHAEWYAHSYRAAPSEAAEASLAALERLVSALLAQTSPDKIVLFGFSQGACLAAEFLARRSGALAGLVALSGARIGPRDGYSAPETRLDGTRVLLAIAEADPWVDRPDVDATAAFFSEAGADVLALQARGDVHEVRARERIAARRLILGAAHGAPTRGFGGAHESEGLPGALPLDKNSPRRAPYGLLPEQINGTGFVARRKENLRVWLYRIRQATQISPYTPLSHPTFSCDFGEDAPDPNLCGYRPLDIPDAPTDFVDGLATFGGAGSAQLRRGFAIHMYVANRSMEHRAFYNADGDFLLIPSVGRLTLQTELGVLEVGPGQVALLPRGIKFSVLLADGEARGYVGEVFGRHFELPERGPIGANGLADERHFVVPSAWHEDRVDPGYRVAAKFGGHLFEATQDYSPYDVVAWHGNYTPYAYDLMAFSPVSTARFDHPDPSIYTVLSAPLDEQGSHTLDFVFFPPRWETAEDTFRPPYFHRNATTEFNGIIADPSLRAEGPFYAGGYFLTPSMTAHGVLARSVERSIDADDAEANKAVRTSARAMWFQFETALPVGLTPWARGSENRVEHWHDQWGIARPYFDPSAS